MSEIVITEKEVPHEGWEVSHFTFVHRDITVDTKWKLTTIDDGTPVPRSLLSRGGFRDYVQGEGWWFWPHSTAEFGGILTVEGCVAILKHAYAAYDRGKERGRIEAQTRVCEALGLR